MVHSCPPHFSLIRVSSSGSVTNQHAAVTNGLHSGRGFRYSRAPGIRAHVARVAGKEPVMAFEVFHAVLQFSVFSFVEILYDVCPGTFAVFKVPLHILDEDGQALISKSELGRTAIVP